VWLSTCGFFLVLDVKLTSLIVQVVCGVQDCAPNASTAALFQLLRQSESPEGSVPVEEPKAHFMEQLN
jgi:hypothetical protein